MMYNLQNVLDKILDDIRSGRGSFDRNDAFTISSAISKLQFYGDENNYENGEIEKDKGSLARVELM